MPKLSVTSSNARLNFLYRQLQERYRKLRHQAMLKSWHCVRLIAKFMTKVYVIIKTSNTRSMWERTYFYLNEKWSCLRRTRPVRERSFQSSRVVVYCWLWAKQRHQDSRENRVLLASASANVCWIARARGWTRGGVECRGATQNLLDDNFDRVCGTTILTKTLRQFWRKLDDNFENMTTILTAYAADAWCYSEKKAAEKRAPFLNVQNCVCRRRTFTA